MFSFLYQGNIMHFAGGSLLEAMATAVENAGVVLICFSDRYKKSPQCRTGCQVISTKNKP